MPTNPAHQEYFERLSKNQKLSLAIYSAAEEYLARETQRAQRTGKLVPFRPFTADGQARYIAEHFGEITPEGLGVKQGHYISLSRADSTPQRRFLATDFLMDCHALILVGRDAQGTVQQTVMAHVDRYTNLTQSVPELLAQMPEGARVEATIIGGSKGYNHYLHGGLLNELARAPSVTRIRHGVDAGSTVAVDTHTGKVLVALTPDENEASSYFISELPLRIDFGPKAPEHTSGTLAPIQHGMADLNRTPAILPLRQAYDIVRGEFILRDALGQQLYQLQTDDQKLSHDDLLQLARSIGESLQTPVAIAYHVADDQLMTLRVQRASDHADLGVLYATMPDPTLGPSGRISER